MLERENHHDEVDYATMPEDDATNEDDATMLGSEEDKVDSSVSHHKVDDENKEAELSLESNLSDEGNYSDGDDGNDDRDGHDDDHSEEDDDSDDDDDVAKDNDKENIPTLSTTIIQIK